MWFFPFLQLLPASNGWKYGHPLAAAKGRIQILFYAIDKDEFGLRQGYFQSMDNVRDANTGFNGILCRICRHILL
jgi:hypothetical protein